MGSAVRSLGCQGRESLSCRPHQRRKARVGGTGNASSQVSHPGSSGIRCGGPGYPRAGVGGRLTREVPTVLIHVGSVGDAPWAGSGDSRGRLEGLRAWAQARGQEGTRRAGLSGEGARLAPRASSQRAVLTSELCSRLVRHLAEALETSAGCVAPGQLLNFSVPACVPKFCFQYYFAVMFSSFSLSSAP